MSSVMIVDDSQIIRYRLRDMLKRKEFDVIAEAEDGRQAVRMYKESRPDIVTMDLTMPHMDGIAAINAILEYDSQAKIIVISAMGQKFKVLQALKAGAQHFIVKPFDDDKIVQVLHEVLGTNAEDNDGGEAAQNDELPVVNEETGSQPGYLIENNRGTFTIKLFKQPSREESDELFSIIHSLIYIKPLTIVFDFTNIEYLDINFVHSLSAVIDKINSVKGSYSLCASSEKFVSYIKSMHIENMTVFI
jgi:two-component system chemotaxis response regulator CheY